MRFLVFQHIDCEHPGSLRGFLAKDGAEWAPVHLHRGEPIPSLEPFDALWVMGGPMDVWDVEEHPWLIPEKAAIGAIRVHGEEGSRGIAGRLMQPHDAFALRRKAVAPDPIVDAGHALESHSGRSQGIAQDDTIVRDAR